MTLSRSMYCIGIFVLAACGGSTSNVRDPNLDGSDENVQPSYDASIDGAAPPAHVDLSQGHGSVGFDDLRYSSTLARIISAPGGTNRLVLIDPETLESSAIDGVGPETESADEGRGLLFAGDRAGGTLRVVDPQQQRVIANVNLRGTPDYVRWSESTGEIWVTEPGGQAIEILSLSANETTPISLGSIPIAKGPEGLAIDNARKLAYVHAFDGHLVVINLNERKEIARWSLGCGGAHGIPVVDEKRGFVFAGCRGSEIVGFDVAQGKEVGRYKLGSGTSILAYSQKLGHAYLRGDPGRSVAVLGVEPTGALSLLGTWTATGSGHCMTADDRGGLWVCDAPGSGLVRFSDPYPSSL